MQNLLIFSVAFVFLIFQSVDAQEERTSFGLLIGTNIAKHRLPISHLGSSSQYVGKFGFQAGGFAKFSLSKRLMLQPSLLFARHGTRRKVPDAIIAIEEDKSERGSFKTQTNEWTIVLPFLFHYVISNRTYVLAGPQLRHIIGGKTRTIETSFSNNWPLGGSSYREEPSYQGGVTLGIGRQVSPRTDLVARYYHGIGGACRLGASVLSVDINVTY